ncbi:MAG: DUF6483 family protein [Ignavibacteriaceae bacterium]
MLTKDYLMRMIDTLVKALAKLVFLKDAKDYKTALTEINNMTKEFFGLDLNFVNNISDEQLIDLIGKNELLLPGNCYVFAVLIKEEAELFELQNESQKSLNLYERSLALFVEGLKNSPTIIEPGHLDKINFVIEKLKVREISIDTEENLLFYYEFSGKFDKAENILYDLMDYDPLYIENGLQFCERLLQKPDEDLIKGNLPRDEVEESLASLREKLRLKSNLP